MLKKTLAGLALGLTFQQQSDPARQPFNLAFLPRNHIGKILDGAGQMGDLLFDLL